MSRPFSQWCAGLALLVAGCGGDPAEPIDGGRPLDLGSRADDASLQKDPCWRREKAGWHYSIGHCRALAPMERMSGVWITGFEESSFIPDATAIPDPNDPSRFTQELEVDGRKVARLTGEIPFDGHRYEGDAYLVTIVGRRTRDPYSVDCNGLPYFTVVVDRVTSARYLGPMGRFSRKTLETQMQRLPMVARRHGGRWGELEQKAIERCSKRRALPTTNE